MTKILYLGSQREVDEYTARLLCKHLAALTGNRALWVNSGGKGVLVVHPGAKA